MRIILVGFGTVGQALAKILHQDADRIVKSQGFEPKVTTIIDSRGSCSSTEGLDIARALQVKEKYGTVAKYPGKGHLGSDPAKTVSESEAEVVVETTPTNFEDGEPGMSNIRTALGHGKHVITTNKGPLALAMPALLELAEHRGLKLRFSGTVGGGTPFLDFAAKCLPGETIASVRGILNGTTKGVLARLQASIGGGSEEGIRRGKPGK